jgi:hypothetical protein
MRDPDFFQQYADRIDAEIDADLEALQRVWGTSKTRNGERDGHLLEALCLCHMNGRLPDWLFNALSEIVAARLPKALLRDHRRWAMVREGVERGLTWDGAYHYASEKLAGTEKRSRRTMKGSYQKVQAGMPKRRRVGGTTNR